MRLNLIWETLASHISLRVWVDFHAILRRMKSFDFFVAVAACSAPTCSPQSGLGIDVAFTVLGFGGNARIKLFRLGYIVDVAATVITPVAEVAAVVGLNTPRQAALLRQEKREMKLFQEEVRAEEVKAELAEAHAEAIRRERNRRRRERRAELKAEEAKAAKKQQKIAALRGIGSTGRGRRT